MCKYPAAAAAVLACTLDASAAVAVPGTLNDYLALGPEGASIGSTVFSGFSLLPTQAGAVPISPALVQVTPLFTPGNPGLLFSLNQSASAGELFELRLAYNVADLSIFGASVSILGASTFGDGAITSILDGMPGGPPLIAFSSLGITDSPAQGSFSPVASLPVQLDTVVDGGLAGQSSLASTTNRFTAVPEPASFLLGTALLGVSMSTRQRKRRKA